jgi:hypothetical protein
LIKETNSSRDLDALRNLSKSVDNINKNDFDKNRFKYQNGDLTLNRDLEVNKFVPISIS